MQVSGRVLRGPICLSSDLRLTLNAGCWTCLLGSSGVGKTTLLRLIAGLPGSGRLDGCIEVDDGLPLAGRIAYMGQSDLIAPWLDVFAAVTLGARLRGEPVDGRRAQLLIEQVGLGDHLHKRPAELSGGMRQRVALARTLMEDRPLVLLDEPFSALDARTRADMQELAFACLRGRTVLLVTHDPAEAVRLGHALYLMRGEGLQAVALPPAAPVRDPADAATLEAQARLLGLLRSS